MAVLDRPAFLSIPPKDNSLCHNCPTHLSHECPTHLSHNCPTHLSHECPTHLSHKCPTHLSYKCPIPISHYILTSHILCACVGNFHITSIDVPVSAGAPPLDTQLYYAWYFDCITVGTQYSRTCVKSGVHTHFSDTLIDI